MRQELLIDYITDGIMEFLNRQPVRIPSDAANEVAQLVFLREYIVLNFAFDQDLSLSRPFDAYEVNPVLETNGAECEAFSSLADACEALARAEYAGSPARILWTLYGHISRQGVQVIEDCESEEEAFALLYKMTGIRGVSGTTHYPALF